MAKKSNKVRVSKGAGVKPIRAGSTKGQPKPKAAKGSGGTASIEKKMTGQY